MELSEAASSQLTIALTTFGLPISLESVISATRLDEGYFDDVEINKVMAFEKALHEFARSNHKDLLDMINESLDYNDDIDAKMKSTMDDFKANGVW